MKCLFITTLLALLHMSFYAQEKEIKRKLLPVSPDCKTAIKITRLSSHGPTIAPNGAGEVSEIRSGKKNDLYSFEKEHNSAWYFFEVPFTGNLGLKIIPIKPTDDYDFLLYRYTDSNFCSQVFKKKVQAVRTNISRTGLGYSEITGLSGQSAKECVASGKGDQFSKALEVKKGERFYLVVDNVYPNGEGHTIEIGIEKEVKVAGTVLNDKNEPISGAEVTLEDDRGRELSRTYTDNSGKYELKAYLIPNREYNLAVVADSSFSDVTVIHGTDFTKNKYQINDLKTVLPKLKGGKNYILKGLNFYGNSPVLLPQSQSSLKALLKLMKKNKNLTISIEGHVNDPGGQGAAQRPGWDQKLSEMRAAAVFDFLVNNGIQEGRMSKKGFANLHMLFPHPKNSDEEEKNRRVEINVLSIQ